MSPPAAGWRATTRCSARMPSAAINRMLARLTGVDLSDFGCAFNAYRREALDPVMHRIGRQKFTKAIVCSTGVRVVEVDLQHRAREGRSRYRPLALVKIGLQVVAGFWPGLSQRVGTPWRLSVSFRASAWGCGVWSTGSGTGTRPASSSSGRWCCFCWAFTAP